MTQAWRLSFCLASLCSYDDDIGADHSQLFWPRRHVRICLVIQYPLECAGSGGGGCIRCLHSISRADCRFEVILIYMFMTGQQAILGAGRQLPCPAAFLPLQR